jgi:hypothetical protein
MDDERITTEIDGQPTLQRVDAMEPEERPHRRRYGSDFQKDREHLKMLSIFYFVLCGLNSIGLFFGVVYIAMGLAMVVGSSGGGPNAPPPAIGFMIAGIGLVVTVFVGGIATCVGLTGYCLRKRKWYTFCLVTACCICVNVPVGTLLGIFTILVLQRESVKELFRASKQIDVAGHPPSDDDDAYRD